MLNPEIEACLKALLEIASDLQSKVGHSGLNYTRKGVSTAQKITDAYARIMNLKTKTVCVAACSLDLESNKKMLLVASNSKSTQPSSRHSDLDSAHGYVWKLVFQEPNNSELYKTCLETYIQRIRDKEKINETVHGYLSFHNVLKLSTNIQQFSSVLAKCDTRKYTEQLKKWYNNVTNLLPLLQTSFECFVNELRKQNKVTTEFINQYKALMEQVDGLVNTFKELKNDYKKNSNSNKNLFELISENEQTYITFFSSLKHFKKPLYDFRKLYSDIIIIKKNATWWLPNKITISKKVYYLEHAEMKNLEYLCSEDHSNLLSQTNGTIRMGITKLACAACECVINYFNSMHPKNTISIKGAHGKVYNNWKAPGFLKDNGVLTIIQTLTDNLQSGKLIQQLIRSDSADTDTSGLSRSVSLESMGTSVSFKNITLENKLLKTMKCAIGQMFVKLLELKDKYPEYIVYEAKPIILGGESYNQDELINYYKSQSDLLGGISKWLENI